MLEVRVFFSANQCCAILICFLSDLAQHLIPYGESHVIFLTDILALKKG